MFDDYDWISEDPSNYDFSSGDSSSFYAPEYHPSYDFSSGDYILPESFQSLQDQGLDIGSYLPASLDLSSQSLPTGYFSDMIPGASFSGIDPGISSMINSVDDPYLRTSLAEQGADSNLSPEAKILTMTGEGVRAGDGSILMGDQMLDPTTLANMLGSGIHPGQGYEGLQYNPIHALGRELGTVESGYGLRTGALDKQGYLGFDGPSGNDLGQGLMLSGAPSRPMSLSDLQLLDEAPESTLDSWAKNQDLNWSDYAKQNGYDPFDLGTDAISLLGSKLANMGRGGSGGSGAGVSGASQQLAKAVAGNEKASTSEKSPSAAKAIMGGLNMAGVLAALLAGGNKSSPKSSQGDLNSNAWNVARMRNRGIAAPRMADGGSVLHRVRQILEEYGPSFKPATTEYRRSQETRPDPRQLLIDGSGMLQNAGRTISGRQQQLDELERQAVQSRAMGGQIFGNVVSPSLVKHASGGQADKVHAALSGGEYIMDADVVSALGDGNTDAGAAKLDEMRENIRRHKRSAPTGKIPPPAKSPFEYMKRK